MTYNHWGFKGPVSARRRLTNILRQRGVVASANHRVAKVMNMNSAGLQSCSLVGEDRKLARGPFVYTLIVDGKPLLCFAADRSNEAVELTREQWLRNDLCALTSSGAALCHRRSKFSVRQATFDERKTYTAAAVNHVADDDLFLAFLVAIDS